MAVIDLPNLDSGPEIYTLPTTTTSGSARSHSDETTSVAEPVAALAKMHLSGSHNGEPVNDKCDENVREDIQNADSVNVNEMLDTIGHCSLVQAGGTLPDTMELRGDLIKGEGLFARRDISVLEPICALSYSLFMALETEKLSTTCYSCLAVTSSHIPHIKGTAQADINLKACTGCSQVKFCNKECQAKAWRAYHKLECKIFSDYRENFPPMVIRAVMRIVLLKAKGLLPNGYWYTLMNDLVCHKEVWGAAPENNITAMARDIKFVTNSKLSLETLTKLFWVMRTNSIELPISVHGGIGTMLDPVFAKLNHSCNANIMLYRPWHTSASGWNLDSNPNAEQQSMFATVIPLRDIKAGEEFTISYSDPTSSVSGRNAKHMDNYYFDCTCPRCIDDMKAASEIEDSMPIVSAEHEAWSDGVLRQLENLQVESGEGLVAYNKASEAWESDLPEYLDYPALYTASHFDQTSLHLAVHGLHFGAFDKTLINLLRSFFLIYPTRLPGKHNYSNIHVMFVILETFDILLGLSCKDKTVDEPNQADIEQSLRRLSKRGVSKETLIYWRQRIYAHLKKCLEVSAARDLLPLVAQMQAHTRIEGGVNQNESAETHLSAEGAMREALKLSQARWDMALKETGC